MTTIVTLAMDEASQARFNALREELYPAHLNQVAAHLTLFHTLPGTAEISETLKKESQSVARFVMRVSGVMSLGRGVAYKIESDELKALHRRLSARFAAHLSKQDMQGFRPHVVVQNKASVEESKALRSRLTASFVPWQVEGIGLHWWDYKGGPWELRESFVFGQA